MSNTHEITIAIGLPTKSYGNIYISMTILQPNLSGSIYSKQILHRDEEPFSVTGNTSALLNIKDKKIAPAICYFAAPMVVFSIIMGVHVLLTNFK